MTSAGDPPIHVVRAGIGDTAGLLSLAAQVEEWFGPMAGDPGFHAALERNIRRGTALVVRAGDDVRGGLLTGGRPPVHRLNWLVVDRRYRGRGIGRALVEHAVRGFAGPGTVDVMTFGADHPGANAGARALYRRLGFRPGETAPPGPERGSRQWFHLTLEHF